MVKVPYISYLEENWIELRGAQVLIPIFVQQGVDDVHHVRVQLV